jgi:hypothetical protein
MILHPGNRSVLCFFTTLALFAPSALFSSCGPVTVEDHLAAAVAAMDKDDFEKSYELYQSILDWKGEGDVSGDQRFRAAFESSRCLVFLNRFDQAVGSFIDLEKSFPAEMNQPTSYPYVLHLCTDFLRKPDSPTDRIIDLIEYGTAKYLAQKEGFACKVVEVMKRSLTDEQKERLRKNGYF